MARPSRRSAFVATVLAGGLLAAPVLAQEAAPTPSAPAEAPQPAPTPASTAPGVELAPGVRFEVVSLKRLADKGVTELRFAVANGSEADTSLKEFGLAGIYNVDDIYLVDFAAKKQYDIGSAAKCLCSTFRNGDGGMVRAGERREFWAWYALLSAGTKQVSIQIPDQQPIMNVPLQ